MNDLQKSKLEKWLDEKIFNQAGTLWFSKELANLKKQLDPAKIKEHFGISIDQLSVSELREAILDNFYRELGEHIAENRELEYSDRLMYAITDTREQIEICLRELHNEDVELVAKFFEPFWSVRFEEIQRELAETPKEGEVRPFKPR